MSQCIPTVRTSSCGRSLRVAGEEATHGSLVRQDGGGKDIGCGYLREARKDALGMLESARP